MIEQWRDAILEQILKLREQPSPGKEAGPWMGRGFGALWAARPPEGLPPALKAIDLRVVDDMLGNASWVSRVFSQPYVQKYIYIYIIYIYREQLFTGEMETFSLVDDATLEMYCIHIICR